MGDSARKLPHSLPFPVVGIGASAGGIQALLRFFEHMPQNPGMAFVVVVHLSPRLESPVDEILQQATRVRVVQVSASVRIEKNHVYVISPASNLEMLDGKLHVVPAQQPRERHIVIDAFFRTLAAAHTDRAIGIVMSGTGADGSMGMARIKEQGGVTLAQSPDDAEYDDMPRAAIENRVVDFVLPVADMPQKLLELWSNASRISPPPASRVQLAAAGKPPAYAQLHQRALDKLGPPTVLIDSDFRIVHLSDRAGEYLRYAGGEPSHHLPTLVRSELQGVVRMTVHEALKKDAVAVSQPVLLAGGEDPVEIVIAVTPFRDEDTAEKLLLVLFQEMASKPAVASADKEELESINEELTMVNFELELKVDEAVKINDDLQNLIASSDSATVFVDSNMQVKWYTPRTVNLFNLILTDRGRPLQDITHRLEYPNMIEDAQRAFRTLRVIEREVRTIDNRWFLAKILPYRTAEDRIEGAVLNFVDISERVKAQEALREGLERLRLISESTKDFAIISMDEQGVVTGWNRAAEILFGYTAPEMEGNGLDRIFTPEDRAKSRPSEELRVARDRGHAEDERWHVRKDGSRCYCSGVVYPLIDKGSLKGYAKIARDLTDKHVEEHHRASELERSEAANLLKDQFIAIMSHELRHPLNLIQLNTELLARIPEVGIAPKALGALDKIRKAIHNQSQIISDLLDLSRVQTGKLKLDCRPVRLADSIGVVMDAVSVQAKAAHVSLLAPDLDSEAVSQLVINADANRVEQIIWNLLNNAIKFTPAGGTVTISVCQEGGEARVDIKDTGIGIAAESISKVFTMFRQLEGKRNGQTHHGLGIGLALVAQLSEAHGGRASASSPGEGQGSTFSVWLPLTGYDPQKEGGDSPLVSHRLQGLRILVVDDSEDVIDTLSTLFDMEGANVSIARNGKEALAKLEAADFDILVSDLGMPVMDGYTLLARLRHGTRNADIPAIALTGYGYSQKAALVGFTDQMCKPVPMNDLMNRLAELAAQPR